MSNNFSVGCVNTTGFRCNFNDLGIRLYQYATYTCRVRAKLGSDQSAWVESSPITLDKDSECMLFVMHCIYIMFLLDRC